MSLAAQKPTVSLLMDPARTPDLLTDGHLARLDQVCEILNRRPATSLDALAADGVLARTEILLTGWGCPQITGEALDRAPRIRLIAHTASTVKTIVSEAVWKHGITVVSAAAANAVPVAEFTLAAILLSNKQAFASRTRYAELKRKWKPSWTTPNEPGNYNAVVGVVGASRVGRRLLKLLQPFDLSVLLCDPLVSAEEGRSLGAELVSLDELVARSGVVSLHAPALPATRHMIGAAQLARMKDGATLINTARGWLVDHDAMIAELRTGRLNAILDVTDPEPPEPNSELFHLPNVFLTPHVAGAAGWETQRMGTLVIEEIERFVAGTPLQHQVTEDMLSQIG